MILVLFLGCVPAAPGLDSATRPTDTAIGSTDTSRETRDSTDSAPTTQPVDADGDGWALPDDCDDTDTNVYPGAAEAWDGADGDCDGRVDADGAYEGSLRVDATAIYEGVSRPFRLDCPTGVERRGGVLTLTMVCTPDPADELAQLLLGATVTLTAADDLMGGGTWSGEGSLVSSDGWTTSAQVGLEWRVLTEVEVVWQLDTRSLDALGSGTLVFTGA